MKTIKRILLLAAVIMASVAPASARTMERWNSDRAVHMARQMAQEMRLDRATAQRFVDTYCDYDKAMWRVLEQDGKSRHDGNVYKHEKKVLSVKEKYYKRFSRFLSHDQVRRVMEPKRQAGSPGPGKRPGPDRDHGMKPRKR